VEPIALFSLQFLWFLFAWSLITYFGLWPWSATLSPDARLSAWVAPQTAMLAASAFLGLRAGWRAGRGLAWACTLVGSLDLLIAFPHAASTGAISHLATQWYVPVFAGPPLVISHVVCFILLVRGPAAVREP
jgi:hypothetical protein